MTDPTPATPPPAPPAAPPSTTSTILVKAQELSGRKFSFSFSIGKLLMGAALIGLGFYWGTTRCTGFGETEKRQLKGDLTAKELEIQAAKLEIGKIETDLKSAKDIAEALREGNVKLSETAADLAQKYNLKIDQYARLKAQFAAVIKGGSAGALTPELVASATPECASCKGAVSFGAPNPYATCLFGDYAALRAGNLTKGNASLKLNLGVRIESVSLKQQPKDGTLSAVIGKVYLVDNEGSDIAEGALDPSSKAFTAPTGFGDLNRRHFYVAGGIDARSYKLGILHQKGVKPLLTGMFLTQDFRGTGGLGVELLLGWQLR